MPSSLRLLADDLTGALDSAARFVPLTGPVAVTWRPGASGPAMAFDSGTRDLPYAAACSAIERLAPWLHGADIAFKKIDSLLRGHIGAEVALCLAGFDHCIVAPAFPYQGRVTRGGRQHVLGPSGWEPVAVALPDALAPYVRDAESEDDLDAIVAHGRRLPGRVLWCGTGGLAGALAGRRPVPRPPLPVPLVALVGSDHPVSMAQIAAVPAARAPYVRHCDLPAGISRSDARRHIARSFAAGMSPTDRPGTLVVVGGETLRDLCEALEVDHLDVDGELEPGVPTSVMRGGARDGQRLVSKSGAFGDRRWLARLLGEV